jgi:hypothetical protein
MPIDDHIATSIELPAYLVEHTGVSSPQFTLAAVKLQFARFPRLDMSKQMDASCGRDGYTARSSRSLCCLLAVTWLMVLLTVARFSVVDYRMLRHVEDESQHRAHIAKNSASRAEGRALANEATNKSMQANQYSNTAITGTDCSIENDKVHNSTLVVANAQLSSDDEIVVRRKGRLILHVGPSKTATTTLQADLTMAHDRGWLSKDRMIYVGRFYHPTVHLRSGVLVLNRSESALLASARTIRSSQSDANTTCCTSFAAILDSVYRGELKSYNQADAGFDEEHFELTVVMSDEYFSKAWQDNGYYRALSDSLRDEWDVVIVAGYRRFYEWILSSKYQRDRTDHIGIGGKELWTSLSAGDDRSKAVIPKGTGRELQPMFPTTFRTWREQYQYTDSILHHVDGIFPIRLINLHSANEKSLVSHLLCVVVAGAEHACALSRQRDVETLEATTLNSQEGKTIPSLYYDAIATEASRVGLIDVEQYTRRQVRETIRYYHEIALGRLPDDLILACPSPKQLGELLAVSMDLERSCMPELGASSGDDHRAGFEAKVATKAYCWVNATANLEQQHWQEFFQQFAANKSASVDSNATNS